MALRNALFSPKKRYLVPMFQLCRGVEKQFEPLWKTFVIKPSRGQVVEADEVDFLAFAVLGDLPAQQIQDAEETGGQGQTWGVMSKGSRSVR